MKNLQAILLLALALAVAGFFGCLYAALDEPEDATALKRKAYEFYERGQYEQSAEMFRGYVNARPADAQAAFDYAMLLARLNRNAEAAEMLETVHRLEPRREAAYFKLGAQYVLLHRNEQAATVFAALAKSANPDMARQSRTTCLRSDEGIKVCGRRRGCGRDRKTEGTLIGHGYAANLRLCEPAAICSGPGVG
jgi:tetratricopeptide (TPR) repeat protein